MRASGMIGTQTSLYSQQELNWPQRGRVILAHFDSDSVAVYQAFRPAIAGFALEHGRLGGEFKLTRMSWIKPSFLWMMYRSGWATKTGQEMILAFHLNRSGFEEILRLAVSANSQNNTEDEAIFQWDPDRDPLGKPLERRALQIGLRGDVLRRFATEWIQAVEDVTPLATKGLQLLNAGRVADVVIPNQRVYPANHESRTRLGLSV